MKWEILIASLLLAGCYASHQREVPLDGAIDAARDASEDSEAPDASMDSAADSAPDASRGECNRDAFRCTALQNCIPDELPGRLHCDDFRVCINGLPSEEELATLNRLSDYIECFIADSCDVLCLPVRTGVFEETGPALCEITVLHPSATIDCTLLGP